MKPLRFLLLPALAAAQFCHGQVGATPTCSITAVPTVVRAEGVAERLGDIVASCTGAPGQTVTGNLTISVNANVTNRIISDSGALDVIATVNNAINPARAMSAGTNLVTFSGLQIPFGPTGRAEVRIANLRADVSASSVPSQFGSFPQPIVAQLAFTPPGLLSFTTSNLTVATPQRGLNATTATTVVPSHSGSTIPALEDLTFAELLRVGTFFSTTRVSEGFETAFEPRQGQATQGTRIMLRFSDYPAGTQLFLPAQIAGLDAPVPTRAGDFGGTPAAGQTQPGTLLLSRVLFTDPNGGGGSVSQQPFGAMTEVQLQNGTGIAVYEVMDANPSQRDAAQIPVFVGLPRSVSARSGTVGVRVTFAPTSTTATTSSTAPVPRFVTTAAPPDCGLFRDCDIFIPRLGAPPTNLDFTLTRGVGAQERTILLSNEGGGLMPWAATIQYDQPNATGWIALDREFGDRPVAVRVIVRALTELRAGNYTATLTIDAGAAGVARYPVRLTVVENTPTSPPPPVTPPANQPRITSVVHGATFQEGSVARGSLITLRGTNLGGNNVSVTFDGRPARILYTSSDQLNLQVPAELTGNTASLVVTANGVASAPMTVNIAGANPGIFTPGILNQDSSVNSPTNPANTGSFVQIYATGVLGPEGTGIVEARLHDQVYGNLPYAGPAPGIPGVQQINLQIPEGWPTMTTEVLLCTTAGGTRQCSSPVKIHIRQVQ